jgi:CubicO group peptidase (beta-lactamase class C family)
MVGRAIEERAFSPSSPVLSLLPQYRSVAHDDARKQRMTAADLMTMASGLACDDNDDSSPGNEDTMQRQPPGTDWYRYTLALPMVADPGTRAVYCSAGINLLGAIVQTATRTPLDVYFRDRFATPMEFGTYSMWLMPPPTNAAYMGGGDRFRPRDFLKFGQLILDRGRWNGRQIVDAGWIAQSIVPRTAPEGEGDRYGYGWHINDLAVDGRSYRVINAGGNGGQLLVVIPALDVSIMLTAGNYNQFPVWRQFLPQVVTAAVRACEPPQR